VQNGYSIVERFKTSRKVKIQQDLGKCLKQW